MKISVTWHGRGHPHELEFFGETEDGLKTEIGARSVEGGPKSAPSPKDHVAMGMASCSAVDIVSTLLKMRQPLEKCDVSCDITQTETHPRVFSTCEITYHLEGPGLKSDRAALATYLSFTKYCGVSAMIEKSGCTVTPKLLVNGEPVDIFSAHQEQKTETIGILITGNEVLLGKTRDSNGPFAAMHFENNGVPVVSWMFCGDEESELLSALRILSEKCSTIIMTGGLGPTSDDLTAQVIAKFLGRETAFNQDAWDVCTTMFKKLGRTEIPESNKKQAELPVGAVVLPNPYGTAAGFVVEGWHSSHHVKIFCLPGVPAEMEPMFLNHVLPRFVKSGQFKSEFAWQVFMLGESKLQSLMKDAEKILRERFPKSSLSYRAHPLHVTYSVKQYSEETDGNAAFEKYINEEFSQEVETRLSERVLYASQTELQDHLAALFCEKKLTLALAESCTGGRLAKEITLRPGSSRYFLGGVVVYSNESKETLLGVSAVTLKEFGAVSVEVAEQMSAGALKKFGSDIAAAITGVAGPGGGTAQHPVGHVCFAIAVKASAAGDVKKLGEALEKFGWRVSGTGEVVTLTATQNFGAVRTRETIQARSCEFVQGSLVRLIQGS